MKPDSATALRRLIADIRARFPFDRPQAQLCAGPCQGCSMKLLAFLDTELDGWQARLDDGERIGLAELSRLMRVSRKVAMALEKGGLMPPAQTHASDTRQ